MINNSNNLFIDQLASSNLNTEDKRLVNAINENKSDILSLEGDILSLEENKQDAMTVYTTAEVDTICLDVFDPALPAPEDVEIQEGTTILSFDEVEGAESYEVFANGNSIGEYQVGGNQ